LARASLIVFVLALLAAPTAGALVSEQVPHDWVYSDYDPCSMCHPMLYDPDAASWDVWYQYRGSTPEAAGYRCAACHYGLNTTRAHVEALANSSHTGLSCTMCHDTFHAGHQFRRGYYYEHPQVEVYGCSDSRACHQVSGSWPQPPGIEGSYEFARAYMVNQTGPGSLLLERIVFGYGTLYFMGIYPMSFINPLNGSTTSVPQDAAWRMCHKCHYTAPTSPPTPAIAYNQTHPDACTLCHSTDGDPHHAQPGQAAWTACQSCHQSIGGNVSSGPHARIACRCHNVVHAAGWDRSGAWTALYYTEERALAPTGSVGEWRHPAYYSLENGSELGVPPGRVEAGGQEYYVYIAYTLYGDAAPINNTSRMATCFNCHMTPGTSGGASPLYLAGDPHAIPPPAPSHQIHPHGRGAQDHGYTILAGLLALTALIAWWRRSG